MSFLFFLVILVSTGLLMCALFGGTITTRRSQVITTIYIISMFFCTTAILMYGDAILARVDFQMSLILHQLTNRFFDQERNHENVKFWNRLQHTYECCGMKNATDWHLEHIPDSCCPCVSLDNDINKCYNNGCTLETAFPHGCITMLKDYMQSSATWLSAMAIAFACFGMFGSFIGCVHGYKSVVVTARKSNTETA